MNYQLFKNIVALIFILFFSVGYAQHSPDKRTLKLFEKSKEAFFYKNYSEAEKQLKKVIERDTLFAKAYLLKTEMALETNHPVKALKAVNKLIAIDEKGNFIAYLIKGNILYDLEQYIESAASYKMYLAAIKNDDKRRLLKRIETCYFRDSALKSPVVFNPENIGSAVNTSNCEYVNSISLDGKILYFTLRPQNTPNEFFDHYKDDEDFYFSVRQDSVWMPSAALSSNINTGYNEGAMNISADGQYVFFTSCRSKAGFGGCDLYYAVKENNSWGLPQNLGQTVNSAAWETQPCFSSDGRTLYFVSTRTGGQGKADIWKTKIDNNGNWTLPQNLGDVINSDGDEMAPYIHPDGKTLYFSSTGHIGMGKSDLFISKLDSVGEWGKPKNLGYPINTSGDEINMIVAANGGEAFISVEDTLGAGCYDIYSFLLPEELKPSPVSYLKGDVFDKETKAPLQALFELVDLESGKIVVESFSDDNGEFLVALPSGNEYGLYVSKDGYLYYSENFSFYRKEIVPMEKDIAMTKIKSEEILDLKNVFFAFDSDLLLEKSITELQNIVRFLNNNAEVKIEIGGHTDSTGTEEYNMHLSENRARKVYDYLVKNGIEKMRLQYKGYGESKPIDNAQEKNRRTEMKVL